MSMPPFSAFHGSPEAQSLSRPHPRGEQLVRKCSPGHCVSTPAWAGPPQQLRAIRAVTRQASRPRPLNRAERRHALHCYSPYALFEAKGHSAWTSRDRTPRITLKQPFTADWRPNDEDGESWRTLPNFRVLAPRSSAGAVSGLDIYHLPPLAVSPTYPPLD